MKHILFDNDAPQMRLNSQKQRSQLPVPDSSVPRLRRCFALQAATSAWPKSPRFAASSLSSLLFHPLAAPPAALAERSAAPRRTSLRLDCYLDPD